MLSMKENDLAPRKNKEAKFLKKSKKSEENVKTNIPYNFELFEAFLHNFLTSVSTICNEYISKKLIKEKNK